MLLADPGYLIFIYCSSLGVGTEWPRGQICPLILAFVHKVLLGPTQTCLFRDGLQSLKYLLYYCLLKTAKLHFASSNKRLEANVFYI